jgi:hypothetical protein
MNTEQNQPETTRAVSRLDAGLDLDAIMQGCQTSTWRDKKRLCEMEARCAVDLNISVDQNPYIHGSHPHRWWNEFYLKYAGPWKRHQMFPIFGLTSRQQTEWECRECGARYIDGVGWMEKCSAGGYIPAESDRLGCAV